MFSILIVLTLLLLSTDNVLNATIVVRIDEYNRSDYGRFIEDILNQYFLQDTPNFPANVRAHCQNLFVNHNSANVPLEKQICPLIDVALIENERSGLLLAQQLVDVAMRMQLWTSDSAWTKQFYAQCDRLHKDYTQRRVRPPQKEPISIGKYASSYNSIIYNLSTDKSTSGIAHFWVFMKMLEGYLVANSNTFPGNVCGDKIDVLNTIVPSNIVINEEIRKNICNRVAPLSSTNSIERHRIAIAMLDGAKCVKAQYKDYAWIENAINLNLSAAITESSPANAAVKQIVVTKAERALDFIETVRLLIDGNNGYFVNVNWNPKPDFRMRPQFVDTVCAAGYLRNQSYGIQAMLSAICNIFTRYGKHNEANVWQVAVALVGRSTALIKQFHFEMYSVEINRPPKSSVTYVTIMKYLRKQLASRVRYLFDTTAIGLQFGGSNCSGEFLMGGNQ